MGWKCAVPGCKINIYKSETTFSSFKIPSDKYLRDQWIAAIPLVDVLNSNQRICEKHFKNDLIITKFVKYDANGKLLAEVPFKQARLREGAVPSIFNEISCSSSEKLNKNNPIALMDHAYALSSLTERAVINIKKNVSPVSEIKTIEAHDDSNRSEINISRQNNELDQVLENSIIPKSFNIPGQFDIPKEILNIEIEEECENNLVTFQSKNQTDGLSSPYNLFEKEPIASNQINSFLHSDLSAVDILNNSNSSVDPCNSLHNEVKIHSRNSIIFDGVTFEFDSESCSASTDHNFKRQQLIALPKPWNACISKFEKEEVLVLSYFIETSIERENHGEISILKKHIVEKNVLVTKKRQITYEIYSTPIDVRKTNLPSILEDFSMLEVILKNFKDLRICKGVNLIGAHMNTMNTNKFLFWAHNISSWQHQNCYLLSIMKDRCNVCERFNKTLNQRIKRLNNRKKLQRVSNVENPFARIQLVAMRRKMKTEKKKNFVLKNRLALLEHRIKKQQNVIGDLSIDVIKQINGNERIVVQEIISAAKRKDARGRRYTDDFIMLCMLMNIRSQTYYEFLRKNNIIPLPCTKTIRNYVSLIINKCGFDEDFFKVLKKSFESKEPMKRHGILVLDEINLRKSIAVESKSLTYSGLIDFGEDGPKGESIKDLATHGLVFMFQSLTGKDSQPIAVFASKNGVGGQHLAKLVIKAVCLLEKSGAVIHGIISDGASTNSKMWKMLDVIGTIENFKNWFAHPLDDNRKIFIFSDTPHLIKCIRNRLYDRSRLRINPEDNFIQWSYFVKLYEVDTSHSGNCRVCPRLSQSHIKLDNPAKMRVRYATQIFSNSVYLGLRFYLKHNYKEFEGCEKTAEFCLQINNLFDALNRKQSNEGLHAGSNDFKVLQEALQWLNKWEIRVKNKVIPEHEYLTKETADGLRVTISSTLDLCTYLINKYNFKYLLTGRVNQDNLEKFFGTIRGAAGSNEHPTCPTFLQLYKLLSVYSVIKPPKYGNCTVTETKLSTIISLKELKEEKAAEYIRKTLMVFGI